MGTIWVISLICLPIFTIWVASIAEVHLADAILSQPKDEQYMYVVETFRYYRLAVKEPYKSLRFRDYVRWFW